MRRHHSVARYRGFVQICIRSWPVAVLSGGGGVDNVTGAARTSFIPWGVAPRSVPQSVPGLVIRALTAFCWSLAPGRRLEIPGITGISDPSICGVADLGACRSGDLWVRLADLAVGNVSQP